AACSTPAPRADAAAATAPASVDASANALLAPSPLPLQYPQFDKIKDSDFGPAFDRSMADHLAEVKAIADNPAAPDFANTIVALEKSGQPLRRAVTVFMSLAGADTNDARKKLQAEYSPKFAAHQDAINLDPKLFARIDSLYQRRADLGLDAEGVRLVERYHDDFIRAGAKLSDTDKVRLKAINAELAKLGTDFNQNVLAEVNDSAIVVDTKEELDGLSDEAIAAA